MTPWQTCCPDPVVSISPPTSQKILIFGDAAPAWRWVVAGPKKCHLCQHIICMQNKHFPLLHLAEKKTTRPKKIMWIHSWLVEAWETIACLKFEIKSSTFCVMMISKNEERDYVEDNKELCTPRLRTAAHRSWINSFLLFSLRRLRWSISVDDMCGSRNCETSRRTARERRRGGRRTAGAERPGGRSEEERSGGLDQWAIPRRDGTGRIEKNHLATGHYNNTWFVYPGAVDGSGPALWWGSYALLLTRYTCLPIQAVLKRKFEKNK